MMLQTLTALFSRKSTATTETVCNQVNDYYGDLVCVDLGPPPVNELTEMAETVRSPVPSK